MRERYGYRDAEFLMKHGGFPPEVRHDACNNLVKQPHAYIWLLVPLFWR